MTQTWALTAAGANVCCRRQYQPRSRAALVFRVNPADDDDARERLVSCGHSPRLRMGLLLATKAIKQSPQASAN
jgi:hypothetical protein